MPRNTKTSYKWIEVLYKEILAETITNDGSYPEIESPHGYGWVPKVDFKRVQNWSYQPYVGTTEWDDMANDILNATANKNFRNHR